MHRARFQAQMLELIRRTSAFLPPDVTNVLEVQRALEAEGGLSAVYLTPGQVAGHYAGFSNSSLWPLLHYMPEKSLYEDGWWEQYRQVNELFKKIGGRDISDAPARAFTGFITLADAINRAKSTDPEAIRKALVATNIPADQLIMPWTGVKFDEKGQNSGVRAILQQAQKGAYVTIYPFELAAADLIYPIPGSADRK